MAGGGSRQVAPSMEGDWPQGCIALPESWLVGKIGRELLLGGHQRGPAHDVPAGQIDHPTAVEIHFLVIAIILRWIVATDIAVTEAQHITHGVQSLVDQGICGREEVGERLVVYRTDVRM